MAKTRDDENRPRLETKTTGQLTDAARETAPGRGDKKLDGPNRPST